MWFWLSRPTSGGELRRWLKGSPADPSIFGAGQPIYTAAPVFADGIVDHLSERLVSIAGANVVEIPPRQAFAPPPAPPPKPLPEPGSDRALKYAIGALRAAAIAVATAPVDSRHVTCRSQARGLARLVDAGLLAGSDVIRVMDEALVQAGKATGEGSEGGRLGAGPSVDRPTARGPPLMDAILPDSATTKAFVQQAVADAVADAAPVPVDLSVLRLHRRSPPRLPLDVFGDRWARWINDAAAASACPPDYVVAPLLASVSVLIGNSRWAQANEGWSEPPHLWMCSVGDSGGGKSPGADPLMRRVLPVIEGKMIGDFPERQREHQAAAETAKARREGWEKEVRTAAKMGKRAAVTAAGYRAG